MTEENIILSAISDEKTVYLCRTRADAEILKKHAIPAILWHDGAAEEIAGARTVCIISESESWNEMVAPEVQKLGIGVKSFECNILEMSFIGIDAIQLDAIVSKLPVKLVGGMDLFQSMTDDDEYYRFVESKGQINSVATRFPWLRLAKRKLYVCTGLPNKGKSEVIDQLLIDSIREDRWKWFLFSPETDVAEHRDKLTRKLIQRNTFSLADTDAGRAVLSDTGKLLSRHLFRFDYEKKRPTVENIKNQFEKLHAVNQLDGIVLDPYNTMIHPTRNIFDAGYLCEYIQAMKSFIKKHNIVMIHVAHPSKVDTEKTKRVGASQIGGGMAWWAMCDYFLAVNREKDKDADVTVEKSKSFHIAKVGKFQLKYNKETTEVS